jgi:hypothetical protein
MHLDCRSNYPIAFACHFPRQPKTETCEGEAGLPAVLPRPYPPPIFGMSTISLSGRSTAEYAS